MDQNKLQDDLDFIRQRLEPVYDSVHLPESLTGQRLRPLLEDAAPSREGRVLRPPFGKAGGVLAAALVAALALFLFRDGLLFQLSSDSSMQMAADAGGASSSAAAAEADSPTAQRSYDAAAPAPQEAGAANGIMLSQAAPEEDAYRSVAKALQQYLAPGEASADTAAGDAIPKQPAAQEEMLPETAVVTEDAAEGNALEEAPLLGGAMEEEEAAVEEEAAAEQSAGTGEEDTLTYDSSRDVGQVSWQQDGADVSVSLPGCQPLAAIPAGEGRTVILAAARVEAGLLPEAARDTAESFTEIRLYEGESLLHRIRVQGEYAFSAQMGESFYTVTTRYLDLPEDWDASRVAAYIPVYEQSPDQFQLLDAGSILLPQQETAPVFSIITRTDPQQGTTLSVQAVLGQVISLQADDGQPQAVTAAGETIPLL